MWTDRAKELYPERLPKVKLPWYLLDDDSDGKRYWDLLLSALIVYSVIVIPYRIGFRVDAADGWYIWVRVGAFGQALMRAGRYGLFVFFWNCCQATVALTRRRRWPLFP